MQWSIQECQVMVLYASVPQPSGCHMIWNYFAIGHGKGKVGWGRSVVEKGVMEGTNQT
jgi:hypothetical protein